MFLKESRSKLFHHLPNFLIIRIRATAGDLLPFANSFLFISFKQLNFAGILFPDIE